MNQLNLCNYLVHLSYILLLPLKLNFVAANSTKQTFSTTKAHLSAIYRIKVKLKQFSAEKKTKNLLDSAISLRMGRSF